MKVKGCSFRRFGGIEGLRREGAWSGMKRACTADRSVISLIFFEGGEPSLIDLSQSDALRTRKAVIFA